LTSGVTAQNPFHFSVKWRFKAQKAVKKPRGCDATDIIFDLNS